MANRGRPRHPDILTPREWQVLELLRSGLSNAQVADRLGISERTAKFHVSEILSKLGVDSREEAATWQPEELKHPRIVIPFPLRWGAIAKIAGATLVAASAAGLAVLAWGVLRTDAGREPAWGSWGSGPRDPPAIQTQSRSHNFDLDLQLNIDKPAYDAYDRVYLTLTVTPPKPARVAGVQPDA